MSLAPWISAGSSPAGTGQGITPSTTAYSRCINGVRSVPRTTETDAQAAIGTAVTLQNLRVRVQVNDCASSTATLRKNAADGNQVVTIGASLTGEFEDTTHSDSVAIGDKVDVKWIAGAGTNFRPSAIRLLCNNNGNPLSRTGTGNTGTPALTAAGTYYFGIGGDGRNDTTESNIASVNRIAATLAYLEANISANTWTGATVITLRKNGVDTALTVTIGANSGQVQTADTTHSVTVAPGDTLSYSVVLAAGSGSMNVMGLSCDVRSSGNSMQFYAGIVLESGTDLASAVYSAIGTLATVAAAQGATEDVSQIQIGVNANVRDAHVNLTANAQGGNFTFSARKNAVNASTATVGTAATGTVVSTDAPVPVSPTDALTYGLTFFDTNAISIGSCGCVLDLIELVGQACL